MPKISKIRLVGCKYDGFKKCHENSIYDLTRNGEPDHTLFTLKNGGGKGVMMQLIFQIMLPETRWGKNNGNKVISMFYDHKNRLIPYTFHVLLEWKLDTVPEKWLITGICMKAYKRNFIKNDEEEEKVGLNYFLYTYEHNNNGFYTLENIPVYINGESVEYEDFEKFIDDNNRDFVKYSQSSVKKLDSNYYDYMKRCGIFKSEWEILKVINKVEGGVGDYFSKATDNKAIFDNLILPAISENMKNYVDEEDSLKEMFRSNLSITKNLPILLKREGDYRELISYINPLVDNANVGSRIIDMKERCIDEGNDIFFILKDKEKNIENDIDKWKMEIKKGKEKDQELHFEKDNLDYIEIYRDIKNIEEKEKFLQEEMKNKEQDIYSFNEQKKVYEINEILVEMNGNISELEKKKEEKMRLLETLNIEDTLDRIKSLDHVIEGKWKILKSKWEDISISYGSYKNYLEKQLDIRITNKKKTWDVEESLAKEISKFDIKKEQLTEQFNKLSGEFDPFSMSFPEKLFEDIKKQYDDAVDSISTTEEKIDSEQKSIYDLKNKENKIETEEKAQSKILKELKEKLSQIINIENDLRIRVSNELSIDEINEDFSPVWAEGKMHQLEELLKAKEEKLTQLQKELWENNIDKSLNSSGDFWIPNGDVLSLKDKIKSLGVNVQTGTQFLMTLNEDERKRIVEEYPSFIYGLVIGNEEDLSAIEKSIEKDFLLHNLVPIYMRTKMNEKEQNSFGIVENQGFELVDEDNYPMWIGRIEKEHNNISQAIKSVEKGIDSIRDLMRDIMNWQSQENSLHIKEKLDECNKVIKNCEENIIKINEEINEKSENITLLKYSLKDMKEEKEKLKQSVSQLESYLEEKSKIDEEEIAIAGKKKKLGEVKAKLEEIEIAIENIKKRTNDNELAYEKWKIHVNDKLKDIREVLLDAKIDFSARKDIEMTSAPFYEIEEEDVFIDLNERKALSEDIENRSKEIKIIEKDIQNVNEKIERNRKELGKIDLNWEKCEYLNLPINEIEIILEEIKRNLKKLKQEYDELKSEKDGLGGALKEKKKSLKKEEENIYNTYNKAPILLESINVENRRFDIFKELESNKNYLEEADKILERLSRQNMDLKEHIVLLRGYKEIDPLKGKMNKILKDKINSNIVEVVNDWIDRYRRIENNLNEEIEKGNRYLKTFMENLDVKVEDELLKSRISKEMQQVIIERFKVNLVSFESMREHFQGEINRLSSDKEKAEQARSQWAVRASKRILKIIESLKEMVSGMVYVNENGYSFPLVKLKGEERLPRDEEDVLLLLKEYFLEAIEIVIKDKENIEDIDEKKLESLMGDKAIFSKALQGRYPVLMVYKMTEKNEFKYAKPRDHYYTTWEAINKGEGDMPEGSGGQTLSINTFVIMMLMNYKKRHIGNENPWTVLVLDNPFGKASAKHILDPIFEIANKLNFQLIAFAAPEIIKAEISERFPVFWELRIGDDSNKDGLITGKVMHGGRVM